MRDLASTLTVTGLFSGSETFLPPTTRKVLSALFARSSLWLTARSGPDVRVIVTSYVFFWPAFRPPSRSYRPVPKPGVFRNWSIAVSTGAFTVYSCAVAPLRIAFQASTTSIRPAPSS